MVRYPASYLYDTGLALLVAATLAAWYLVLLGVLGML